MKGTEGSRGKTAAPSDMMKLPRVRREDPKSSSPRLGSKSCEEAARLRSPRLRSKSRVDYNENMQAFGGNYFSESVEYRPVKGILKKPSTESKDEDDEEVTFGGSGRKTVENPMEKGTHMELRRSKMLVGDVESGPMQGEAEAEVVGENDDDVIANDMVEITKHEGKKKKLSEKNKVSEVGKVKPNEAVNSLGLKRKRGEDEPERLQMKRGQENSYSLDFKREVVEKVKVVGNVAKVARFYSSELGFPVPEGTVRDWVKKSQESKEDDVAQVGEEEEDVAQVGEVEGDVAQVGEDEEEVGESEEETDEEQNNDEEAFDLDDDGKATNVDMKKNEGEEEAEVGVIFDSHPVLVETPITEAFKNYREVELKIKGLEKKRELLEMEEKKLQEEKEEKLLLLKRALE